MKDTLPAKGWTIQQLMDGANERSSTDERGFYMLVFGKLSLLRGACLFQRQELLQSSHKVHGKLFVFFL